MNPEPPKKFSFKTYIDTHPEYKAKHYSNMLEKVQCHCGKMVCRNYLKKHMETKLHDTLMGPTYTSPRPPPPSPEAEEDDTDTHDPYKNH